MLYTIHIYIFAERSHIIDAYLGTKYVRRSSVNSKYELVIYF